MLYHGGRMWTATDSRSLQVIMAEYGLIIRPDSDIVFTHLFLFYTRHSPYFSPFYTIFEKR